MVGRSRGPLAFWTGAGSFAKSVECRCSRFAGCCVFLVEQVQRGDFDEDAVGNALGAATVQSLASLAWGRVAGGTGERASVLGTIGSAGNALNGGSLLGVAGSFLISAVVSACRRAAAFCCACILHSATLRSYSDALVEPLSKLARMTGTTQSACVDCACRDGAFGAWRHSWCVICGKRG